MRQPASDTLDGQVRSLFDLDLTLVGDYRRNCGLLFPGDDLDSAILEIARVNRFDGSWDVKALADIASYYMFYPVIVAMQFRDLWQDYYPFRHCADCLSDVIVTHDREGMRVLHAACASEETALAGYEMARTLFGQDSIGSYDIVDLCSIPVNRVLRFVELSPFAEGIDLRAKVGRIEDIPLDSAYDLILTDRLLGSSPNEEYDVEILRSWGILLRDGGMIITTVEASPCAVLSDEPQVPGELCHEYFCRRYGRRSDGRDAKVGLTSQQWHKLSERYHRVMASTYFGTQGKYRIRSAGDVSRLLRQAGIEAFGIRRVHGGNPVTWEDVRSTATDAEHIYGSLIVYATK